MKREAFSALGVDGDEDNGVHHSSDCRKGSQSRSTDAAHAFFPHDSGKRRCLCQPCRVA